ncbi:unnamed protein product [Callosobruchus maculatus]|uniref:ribonuclease H n=1 Tax=Callosobruchus maculatus TaxID=64391 RepID=A0A653CJS7_CALMS|nr:unnamed protein product [Callosobruchus maculatus]
MAEKLIQWNCNGLVLHYCELKLLISKHKPMCICLQETHLRHDRPYSLRGYNVIRKEVLSGERAHGGVAIILRDDVQFEALPINTDLQVVAVKIKAPLTLIVRVHEILNARQVSLWPQVLPLVREIPPWERPAINLNTQIKDLVTREAHPSVIHANFRSMLQPYPNTTTIFTDGSKTDSGVGCAFVVNGSAHSWSLPKISSSYTAEQYAIWQALHYCCMTTTMQNFVIISDSLSAMTGLLARRSKDPLALMSIALLKTLQDLGKSIKFIWIPSHSGIPGNDLADTAAKLAASSETLDVQFIKTCDQKLYLNQMLIDKWQNEWNSTETQLRYLKPKVRPRYTPKNLSRMDRVKVHRLRLGHTFMTHSYLLCGEDPPDCHWCDGVCKIISESKNLVWFCDECAENQVPELLQPSLIAGTSNDISSIKCENMLLKNEVECLQREKELLNKLAKKFLSDALNEKVRNAN